MSNTLPSKGAVSAQSGLQCPPMTFWGWLAMVVLFLHLPIPLYWIVLHPAVKFWRSRPNAAYLTGFVLSWPPVTTTLVFYRHALFRSARGPWLMIAAGLGLIVLEAWIFWSVHRDLGAARIVGKTELSGGGEIADRGIYARIRHPRYAGSFLAIVGALLLAGTPMLWLAAFAWTVLMRLAILLEERELRARFGAAYEEYCRRVPRFIPVRREP